MIQDIAPSKLDNSYAPHSIQSEDCLLVFDETGRILVQTDAGRIRFTTSGELGGGDCVYLFAIDEAKYFLALTERDTALAGFRFITLRELRDTCGGKELFAAFTAFHLWEWYAENRYCGKCGSPLSLHKTERALQCSNCGLIRYPRINPAVIVGVMKGDCLLITRYRRGFAHNALIAGFTEIGETLEQTVRREVMEEAGIRVKNIRYYKSQPWGIAQDILTGFFCEADGDGEIRMDASELKYAEWVRREDIVLQPNNNSLTNEMMMVFRDGKYPELTLQGDSRDGSR